MNTTQRRLRNLSAIGIAIAAALASSGAAAQAYPSRPVRVIVPFQAGSAPDQIMRITTQHMAQTAGQSFIIDNKPGANGNIGVAEAARAAPDGYTLVSANNTTFAASVSLYRKLPFDPAKDFTPIARFITTGLVLSVRADSPAKDLREFIALAKSRPGKLTAAQASAGMKVAIGMLYSLAGVELLEVPYKGQPQAVGDLIGGQIDMTFADYAAGLAQIRGGKIRGLGVTTPKRSATLPDVPSIGEMIPGYDVSVWAGLAAPAGVSKEVVDQLWKLAERSLTSDETRKGLTALSFAVEPLNPDEFRNYIRSETQRWAKMAKDAKIDPE